ncbi:MAG: bifunctional hydroxymethylpyrimidine kinase/phosphomethylpyrimidine kinase [Gammaproteobacteria bacterium]
MPPSPPIVLCFSGSDPSGGAGIQADLAAIHHLGAHCVSVITALTIQNTQNVFNFYPTPATVILEQANALAIDLPIKAVKIGMIGSLENATAICEWLTQHSELPVILDPVMVAGGGGDLAEQNMTTAIKQLLCPLATIVTPNTIEAYQLAPLAHNLKECAQELLAHGCKNVLIKGSHDNTPEVINLLYNNAGLIQTYTWPRLPHSYHGSGCTLAASIAALLAQDIPLNDAVQQAQTYTWECLKRAYQPGKGQHIPNRY